MMNTRILTICAAATAATAMISLAQAQQAYPAAPGTVYRAPQPYPQGAYPQGAYPQGAYPQGAYPQDYRQDYRRGPGAPDFDQLEDDEAPNMAALPPPGPVLSPDDPRYGR